MSLFFWKKKRKTLTGADVARLPKTERKNLADKLKREAGEALGSADTEEALDIYRQLIIFEPDDPDHRRHLADCHRKLGNVSEEFTARVRAATLYGEAGFLLKGIAMCKMALALEPDHHETQKQLAELNRRAGRTVVEEAAPAHRATHSPVASKGDLPYDAEAALRAARARIERVRKARARVEAARAEAEQREPRVAREEAPAPSMPVPSAVRAAPSLSAIPLSRSMPSLRPVVLLEESPQESLDSEPEIFIAPLDEDEMDVLRGEENSARIDAFLRGTPLLGSLREETFVRLIDEVTLRELSAGEVLFEAGSMANAMYVVVEGRVAAMTPGPLEFELASMGEGDFFGEIGLLADQPRQATIVAREDTRLLEFDRALVARLSETEPEMVRVLLRFVRERLVASLVATNPLFSALSQDEASQLTEKFQFLEVAPGIRLIEQDRPSSGVFIFLTGGAIVEQSADGSSKRLGIVGPGDIVGELSLLNRKPAMADVTIEQKSYVLKLPASDFTSTVMMHPAMLDYVARIAADRERAAAPMTGPNSSHRDDWVQLV